jgi:hypothetical protein
MYVPSSLTDSQLVAIIRTSSAMSVKCCEVMEWLMPMSTQDGMVAAGKPKSSSLSPFHPTG